MFRTEGDKSQVKIQKLLANANHKKLQYNLLNVRVETPDVPLKKLMCSGTSVSLHPSTFTQDTDTVSEVSSGIATSHTSSALSPTRYALSSGSCLIPRSEIIVRF